MRTLIFLLAVTAFLAAAMAPANVSALSDDGRDILKLVNKERKKAKAAALEWDDKLAKFAKEYSAEMARENSISHTDKSGRTIEQRLKDAGIMDIKNAGENLFVGSGGKNINKTAIKMWLRSASHKRNMLDENFTRTGIGISTASNGTAYIAQIFVQPLD